MAVVGDAEIGVVAGSRGLAWAGRVTQEQKGMTRSGVEKGVGGCCGNEKEGGDGRSW